MRHHGFLLVLALLCSPAFGTDLLNVSATYSRGNDDLSEENYETAKITLNLVATEQLPDNVLLTLHYVAVFSTDHHHNPSGGEFWLKQVFNEIEANLTKVKFTYEPGADGTSLGGKVSGSIVLGEFDRSRNGPLRGRIAVTSLPDYPASNPVPIDSWIDWGIYMADGAPQLGNLSLAGQWRGNTRPNVEMLRLIASDFISAAEFREAFPSAQKRQLQTRR